MHVVLVYMKIHPQKSLYFLNSNDQRTNRPKPTHYFHKNLRKHVHRLKLCILNGYIFSVLTNTVYKFGFIWVIFGPGVIFYLGRLISFHDNLNNSYYSIIIWPF